MATIEKVRVFQGPTPKRDRDGFVVIQFDQIPEGLEELEPDWQASVIGWGHQLQASHPDIVVLARWLETRFGKVRIGIGETENPLNWETANW